jgi:hypothetical protein
VARQFPKMNVAVYDGHFLESGSNAYSRGGQYLATCPAIVRHLELRYEHGT